MWLPDLNVLLFAVNTASRQHTVARRALEQSYASAEGVGLAWITLLGFLRLATRPGIFARPLGVEDALAVTRAWIEHPKANILHPGERHHALLAGLLVGAGAAGNLTTDAHLAALAIEHGSTLLSFDRDFQRFGGLRLNLLDVR